MPDQEIWISAKVNDLLTEIFSGEWGSEPLISSQNAKVLRSTDIDDDGHINYSTGAERNIAQNKLVSKHLKKNDLLLEISGGSPTKPVGRIAIFNHPLDNIYLCSNFFRTLRTSRLVLPKFLFWRLLLLYTEPKIWSFQQQTTGIINLKTSEYLRQTIKLPPIKEQHIISNILDTLDTQIQHTEQLIAKLKQVKVGLLHDLLTRGVDENGDVRDPVARPEEFKESLLGVIPGEWKICSIKDLGKWRGGSTPTKSVQDNWYEGNILWISPKDVQGSEITDSEDKITSKALSTYKISLFKANTIIVVFRSGVLRHTLPVAIGRHPFTVNQDLKVLIPKKGVNYNFAFFTLQLLAPKILKVAVKAGTTVESVDLKTFLNFSITLPPDEEQERIVNILHAHDARIITEEANLSKLKQIKKGLMHDLLKGRVRVTQLVDETAVICQ